MESFSQKWFTMYYLGLGLMTFFSGFVLMIFYQKVRTYLVSKADEETPPAAIRNILKYLLLFTIPCLILSFFPFSWIELLFSVWSLFIVYIASIQLVRWNETRGIIQQNPGRLDRYIRLTGAIMVAVGLVIFLLGYLVINRMNLF